MFWLAYLLKSPKRRKPAPQARRRKRRQLPPTAVGVLTLLKRRRTTTLVLSRRRKPRQRVDVLLTPTPLAMCGKLSVLEQDNALLSVTEFLSAAESGIESLSCSSQLQERLSGAESVQESFACKLYQDVPMQTFTGGLLENYLAVLSMQEAWTALQSVQDKDASTCLDQEKLVGSCALLELITPSLGESVVELLQAEGGSCSCP